MILSIKELKNFLLQDWKAHGITSKLSFFKPGDKSQILKFQLYLRLLEFCINTNKNILITGLVRFLYLKKSYKLGFTIPPNVFDMGLCIVHKGTIIISGDAKVGKFCRIHVCTNIGKNPLYENAKAPVIGDNVYIAPGVKIYGDINIGNNIFIGANSVVGRSYPENNILIAGIPAKKIKEIEK